MKSNFIFLFSKWGGRGLADDLSKNYDNTGYEPEFCRGCDRGFLLYGVIAFILTQMSEFRRVIRCIQSHTTGKLVGFLSEDVASFSRVL